VSAATGEGLEALTSHLGSVVSRERTLKASAEPQSSLPRLSVDEDADAEGDEAQ
jgi:hypothetical protein